MAIGVLWERICKNNYQLLCNCGKRINRTFAFLFLLLL